VPRAPSSAAASAAAAELEHLLLPTQASRTKVSPKKRAAKGGAIAATAGPRLFGSLARDGYEVQRLADEILRADAERRRRTQPLPPVGPVADLADISDPTESDARADAGRTRCPTLIDDAAGGLSCGAPGGPAGLLAVAAEKPRRRRPSAGANSGAGHGGAGWQEWN
jgi:hypothetical protein